MKVSQSIKKTFNIGLATMVMAQGLQATPGYVEDILDNSLTNVTPGGKIVDRDSNRRIKSTTFYTTSVYFKFGPAFDYPEPIVNVSPPKISAGCGGLSIKGMFGSIIGLDRLEQMLKNAGASFAWGIAVGLIYSLPGIGAAFKMINNWAKKIQQLLANACQSGMAVGQALSESFGMQDNAVSNALSQADKAVQKLDEHLNTKLKEFKIGKFSFDDNMVLTTNGDDDVSDEQAQDNWRELLLSGLVSYSMSGNVLGTMLHTMEPSKAVIFIQQIWNGEAIGAIENFKIKEFSITFNGSSTGPHFDMEDLMSTYATGMTEEEKSEVARTFMSVAIANYVSGDIVLSGSEQIETVMEKISVIFDPAATDEQKRLAEPILMDLAEGKNLPWAKVQDHKSGREVTELGKQIESYLSTGNTAGTEDSSAGESGVFKIKALKFAAIPLPAATEDNPANAKVFVFFPVAAAGENDLWFKNEVNKKGAYQRSRELIDSLIAPNGLSQELEEIEESKGIKLLAPGIIKKIKIIQQTGPEDREKLIKTLAEYNAYHAVLGAITGFLENGAMYRPEIPAFFSNTSNVFRKGNKKLVINPHIVKLYNETLTAAQKQVYIMEQVAKKSLNERYPNVVTAYELEKLFDEQHTKNVKNAVKSVGSK